MPMPEAPSWTGFYVFGGSRRRIFWLLTANVTTLFPLPGLVPISRDQRLGWQRLVQERVGAGY